METKHTKSNRMRQNVLRWMFIAKTPTLRNKKDVKQRNSIPQGSRKKETKAKVGKRYNKDQNKKSKIEENKKKTLTKQLIFNRINKMTKCQLNQLRKKER